MDGLPIEALEQVATYFQALSEPTRLQILNLLRQREHKVGELAHLCGYTSANISRHLALLMSHGMVARASSGTSVYYRIADPSIYALCDLVCDGIARQLEHKALERAYFDPALARPAPPSKGSGGGAEQSATTGRKPGSGGRRRPGIAR
jgi:DNA-binding transcriptional ArsR family regulator